MMPLQTLSTLTTELEMARALFAAGSYDDVLKVVEPILKRIDTDLITRFVACQLKACVHSERDEWTECLETLERSAPMVDDLPADLRGKFFGQRALAHRNLNDVDAALLDYEQARECALEVGDELTEANIRNNIAKVYTDAQREDEALIEVDAAIKTATRLSDDISLGRYYDSKAQILVSSKRYSEALIYSKRALTLLSGHPAATEAKWTHGLAMIGAGASCLDEPRSIEQFRARHRAAKLIDVELNEALLKSALKRSDGHVLGAAKLLDVSHSAVITLAKKYNLERAPKRRRNKSFITK